jgi:uncharacterized protein (DUF58 family)
VAFFRSLKSSLHHDFCPWANRYVYWLKKPIGWVLLAFVASVLLGCVVSKHSFFAASAIAAVGLIGSMWPLVAMNGLRGSISWSHRRCEEGESIKTTLDVVHRWPWPAWGLFVEADDPIACSVDAPGEPICLARVPALSKSDFEWICSPATRGKYPQQTIMLSTAFPFGIWTSRRKLKVERPLIVWPRTVKLIDVPIQLALHSNGIGSPSDQIGDEGDWIGVRPYREGDSLRQVHWAQTARRDSLVVFERQSRSRPSVSIWFDDEGAAKATFEQREWMIRILASISSHMVAQAWEVQACLNGEWENLFPTVVSKQHWMDRLALWGNDECEAKTTPALKPGFNVRITSSQNLEQLMEQSPLQDREKILWIAVAEGPFESTKSNRSVMTSRVMWIDVCKDPAQQLRVQWQKRCQQSMRTSASA